jgi:ring-1,2-phenylacetyl-CoA epoxidase subunit PaaB
MSLTAEDTQWPRFEVFQQASPGSPFENAGSVHAPDAEIALQNARDVFVRRPQTVSLWVVPAAHILMTTREELASSAGSLEHGAADDGPVQTYYVFAKSSQRRSMTYVTYHDEVEATTAHDALAKTLQRESNDGVHVWWIVPAAAVTSSRPEDAGSLFAPAHDKAFRLPGAYRTRTLMDEVRQAKTEPDSAAGA